MSDSKKKPISSIQAFALQTAKLLRKAVATTSMKERKVSHKTQVSSSGKIEQIAKMLRAEAGAAKKKKSRSKKKKSH